MKKTNLSKAVFMALPLLAASGMAATSPRNSSVSSSRRNSGRNSVVHVNEKAVAEVKQAMQRGAFAAFGRKDGMQKGGMQKAASAQADNKALAFLRKNGLLKAQGNVNAQLSGEMVGRKAFASESAFAHCHFTWSSTAYTNTYATNPTQCANWGGTWHTASSKPVVAQTSVQNKTSTSFNVAITMSENSTVYAVLLLTSQPAPTSTQVINGTDGSGAAAVQTKSQAMSPSGTLSFTGLTAGANYIVYVVGRDASLEVTTTPAQVNPAYETGMIADTASWQFPKTRVAANGDFYVARADGSNIRFMKWNGAGYTLYATLNAAATPGRSWGGWGNEDSVDYEIDASGNLHVVYAAGTTQWAVDYDPFYAVYNGTSWSYTNIGETGYTIFDADLYLDPNGKVHTTFQGAASGSNIRYATNKSGSWVMTSIVSTAATGIDDLYDSYVLADSAGTATVLYRREDNQNNSTDNYYMASSTDGFVTKTLILDGKGDGKRYVMANALMDANGKIHYAYANATDSLSYYRTNASGSWVQRSITNANHSSVFVVDMESIDDTYYFANVSGSTYFLESFDGSTWVDGFDFKLTGYLNDRFAISDTADRVMVLSENASDYTIHYHTGIIAGYITPAVANNPPTDIALTNSSVNQSGGTNATVGTLSSTDADVSDTITYSLVAGTGDTNNASFNISGSTLRANNSAALAAGNYSVRVQTSDSKATYAEAFTITVVDNVGPSVSSVSVPSNSTYGVGQNLSFTVNFNESVTVNTAGGTPRIAITIGSTTRYASYVSGSGTSALVFTYTVQAGDLDADGVAVGALELNSGTLRDATSNNVTLTLNSVGSTASVRVDAVAPSAPSTPDMTSGTDSGSSSSDNITSDTTPTFTGTAEAGATVTVISSVNGTLGTTTADGSGNWTFTPSSALNGGSHNITATAADASGNVSSPSSALAVTIDTGALTGHSVSFTDTTLNASQASAISFSFASAEVGATYSYSITSSGGGTAVTGSGTLASISALIGSINVSGLGDGTLTLSVVVTDSAGNASSAVTAMATLDTAAPTATISSAAGNPLNAPFDATVTFSENVTGFV
ncbi:MAG TPA: Ig-like domain-containing protein, partial [Dongiaceae bacterium]|nr:Ig-like domain-containing protein [Dongiaceae bacterium]